MFIVTGANGFIGSVLVWELEKRQWGPVMAVDMVTPSQRPSPLSKRSHYQYMDKDLLWDYLNTEKARTEVKWILHMGANSSTTETNWNHLLEINTHYTQKLFEWCTENKVGFIYASSAATYGGGENGFDDYFDSEKLKPLNLYGDSKVLFDRWAVKQKSTPPHWYGLKFFNVFGPNEYHKNTMSSVAYKAFHQISKTEELGLFKSYHPNYKDGEQMRDFVYVKDVTRWIMELIEKKPQSDIYNMGFGQPRTWLDLANAVFLAMNKKPKINWLEIPENIKNQYQYFTEAKMTKWKKQGLSDPQWPLEKAVDDYIKNYLLEKDLPL